MLVAAISFHHSPKRIAADESDLDFAAIAKSGRSDGYSAPSGPANLLQDFLESDSLRKLLRTSKIKDPAHAKKHAAQRYLEIAGTTLQDDETLSVTALCVWNGKDYAWCVSVVRSDGTAEYPRVSNRLWINAVNGDITPLVPKSRRLASTDNNASSNTDDNAALKSDGNLLPILAGSQDVADQLKAKLRQSKVPYPEPVRELERLCAASAAPILGQVKVAGLTALGCNVKDFGRDGDLIWIVHKASDLVSFREEIWYNSRNGKTLSFSTEAWRIPGVSTDSDSR